MAPEPGGRGCPPLQAGVGVADITPSPGIEMGGYWGRQSGATAVHDPLSSTALVFEHDGARVALVALDLVGLAAATVRQIRIRVQNQTGVLPEALMVCCSHTHSGPLTLPFRGMGAVDEQYMASLCEAIAHSVDMAASNLQPVDVRYARAAVQLGVNRRQPGPDGTVIGVNPDGPVTDHAHVVQLHGAEEPVLTLFSHAAHAVVLGRDNHCISADFPGAARRLVEAHTRAPAMFVNGACGDVNPRRTRADFAAVEEVGGELAAAVEQALTQAQPLAANGVVALSQRLQLPLQPPPPRLQAEWQRLLARLRLEVSRMAGADPWAQRVPQARLEWARAALQAARSPSAPTTQAFELQVLALPGLALLGLEGEVFTGYQLQLESDPSFPVTILCGYANGCVGYVPAAADYARGGYEVEEAFRVYPTAQMLAPASEALICDAAATLLRRAGRLLA